MKKFWLYTLAFSLFSCDGPKDKYPKGGGSDFSDAIDSANPFHGKWASLKYLRTLLFTRSPAKSQSSGAFYVVEPLMRDTGYMYTYYGGGIEFVLTKGKDGYYFTELFSSKVTRVQELGKDTIILGRDTVVKHDSNTNFPEKYLFKGTYRYGKKAVIFGENRTIDGLDTNQYYEVENNYVMYGMEESVDLVSIGKAEGRAPYYCFAFKKDTLFIYDSRLLSERAEDGSFPYEKGDIRYILVRQQ